MDSELDYAAHMIAKLLLLCSPPIENWKDLFRPIHGFLMGDYMGTGYPFLDAFDKLYDDFLFDCPDLLYDKIREYLDLEQERRKCLNRLSNGQGVSEPKQKA